MKRRGLPIWLLRDVPAFLGVMFSFWPLMILVIRNGFAAMRGKPIPRSVFDQLPILLAHAESRLDFALWREAYRRLGWSPRLVTFQLFSSPETWPETSMRFENYRRANMDLEACVRLYAEDLSQRYGIAKRDTANARSRPLSLAARSTSPALLSSSSAQRSGRWHALARDGGGSHSSRGPPLPSMSRIQTHPTSHAPRARSHPHAQTKRPPSRTAFPQLSGSSRA